MVPETHQDLAAHSVVLAQRSAPNLLDRYDEPLALAALDKDRLRPPLRKQRRVALAIDGTRPDVGHEALWAVRGCLSGSVLLARSLLSSAQDDLAGLPRQAGELFDVPVLAVVSDGQPSIRKAVARLCPACPTSCASSTTCARPAPPIYEMDRHAKKELKKTARGIRKIERQVEKARDGPRAEVVQGYCAAVRSALTGDGRPPLDAKGLLLEERLEKVAASAERVAENGGRRNS
jgi:hypothetical protein